MEEHRPSSPLLSEEVTMTSLLTLQTTAPAPGSDPRCLGRSS